MPEQTQNQWSIFDLREIPAEERAAADIRLAQEPDTIEILEKGIGGPFDAFEWFKVRSGEKVYEVRRFETFAFCSCKANVGCKHIAATLKPICIECKVKEIKTRGGKCRSCEIKTAPYLRPAMPERAPMRIGGIRV